MSNKASVLQSLGRQEELVDTFKHLLKNHPEDINALNDLGIHYAKLNEYEIALGYFDRLLILQPEDQDAIQNNIMALCKVDIEKAKYFHLSKFHVIKDDKMHHLVAMHFDSEGQRSEAERHYDDMYNLSKDEKCLVLKGHFYYSRDPEKAIELFNQYLKNNPDNQEVKQYRDQLLGTPESQALFQLLFKYREYIVQFITMLTNGSYAPIGAYELADGSIQGFLYVPGDAKVDLSPREAVNRMRIEFENRLQAQSLKSYTIYYHSNFDGNENHIVANDSQGLIGISIEYKSNSGIQGCSGISYSFNEGKYEINNISGLNDSQNQQIWNTRLVPDKNYFQDVVAIKHEGITKENELEIRKKYEGKVGDFWKGVFGLSNHEKMQGSDIWAILLATAFAMGTKTNKDNYIIAEFADNESKIKVISKDEEKNIITFYPILNTQKVFSVENKYINEWAHVENVEARIEGQLQNGTEIGYYAADYLQNREIYTTERKLSINLSGIIYLMETFRPVDNDPVLNKDFYGLSPYENGGEDAFQFVGIIQDFKKIIFLGIDTFEGYIISVNLNDPNETENVFSFDMFVNKQNMQVDNLEKGMKISGYVIIQGEIS